MSANFGDLRSCGHELRHKKNIKNGDFWLENLLVRLQLKSHLMCKANIVHNVGFINGSCKPSLREGGGLATKILEAKNGQKVDNFESIYLSKYRF